MAALRYAARKVSGRVFEPLRVVYSSSFVSRPVEEEPRRLLPRVIHGGIPPAPRSYIRFRSTSSDPQSHNKHHLPSCEELAATLESHSKNMDPAKLELQIEHKKKELLHLLMMRLINAELGNKFTKEDQDLLRLLCKTQRAGTTKTIDANRRERQLMVGTAIFLAAVAVVQHKLLVG